MNLTLSADEKLVEGARAWAAKHGTSLNALVREYLEGLTAKLSLEESATLFENNARHSPGRSDTAKPFDRADLDQGRCFGADRA